MSGPHGLRGMLSRSAGRAYARARPRLRHSVVVAYAFDRLGFLQFEQLCAAVLDLEGGIAADAWLGEADRCRSVLSGASMGPPLTGSVLPAPVLVQCAWVRSGLREDLLDAVGSLAFHWPEDVAVASSFVLLTNLVLPARFARKVTDALGPRKLRVRVLGPRELSARVDARPELRRAMPSVLGLRDLSGLIAPEVSDRSSLDRAAAEHLASVFVPTRAYRRALEVLDAHGFAVLTGPAGDGQDRDRPHDRAGADDRRVGGPRVQPPGGPLAGL